MGTFHVPAAIKGFNALLSNNLPRIKPCSANWEIYPDAGVIRVASLARKPTAFCQQSFNRRAQACPTCLRICAVGGRL